MLRRFDGLVSSAPDACPCGLRILPRRLPCSLLSRRSAWRAPTQLLLIAANPFFIFVDALFIAVLPVRLLAFFNGFFRLAGNLVPNLIGHILSGIADFVLRVLGGGNLPIVHQVFRLILGADERRLHALGDNRRFIKNLDILNALSLFLSCPKPSPPFRADKSHLLRYDNEATVGIGIFAGGKGQKLVSVFSSNPRIIELSCMDILHELGKLSLIHQRVFVVLEGFAVRIEFEDSNDLIFAEAGERVKNNRRMLLQKLASVYLHRSANMEPSFMWWP